jgi:hypothetical protein
MPVEAALTLIPAHSLLRAAAAHLAAAKVQLDL